MLVNIFGGIMQVRHHRRRDRQSGPFKEVGFKVPLVVRLEGTNVEQGRKMLGGERD